VLMGWRHNRGWGPTTDWERRIGKLGNRLQRSSSNPEEELKVARKLLERGLKKGGPDSPFVASASRLVAEKLCELDRPQEEVQFREEHLAACRRNIGLDEVGTASAEIRLAMCLFKLERYDDADRLLPHVITVRTSALGEDDPNTIQAINLQSNVANKLGRPDDARALQVKVVDWYDSRGFGESEPAISCVLNLATTLASLREFDESTRLMRRAYEVRCRTLGSDDPSTLDALALLASAELLSGHFAEARKLAEMLVENRERVQAATFDTVMAHELLARIESKSDSG
jgi:tetratricopeptide (TPR) repeat protein